MNSANATSKTDELLQGYSGVSMCLEWSRAGRLAFLGFFATLGSCMNGFFVASFFVERTLRKVGNVFLACVGFSDLIITSGVAPISIVVILSDQWDNDIVCSAQRFLGEAATYAYTIFFMLVAGENYFRISKNTHRLKLSRVRVGILSVSVFALCFIVAGLGVYMDIDYDYCHRTHYGNFYFRTAIALAFQVVPFVLTMFALISASMQVRRRARRKIQYRRSYLYDFDSSTTSLNLTAYILFVLAWTPYLIIVHEYPGTSDSKFYHCAWLGLLRSLITTFFYACLSRNFRRAFAHLFNYCFCKSTLTSSFTSRHRRTFVYRLASGELKVHIMHHGKKFTSPCRFGSSSRDTQEL